MTVAPDDTALMRAAEYFKDALQEDCERAQVGRRGSNESSALYLAQEDCARVMASLWQLDFPKRPRAQGLWASTPLRRWDPISPAHAFGEEVARKRKLTA